MNAIESKERPIMFSSEMVRAILDRRKTQTRRAISPQPSEPTSDEEDDQILIFKEGREWREKALYGSHVIKCPYGIKRDRLWVRETWCCKMDDGCFVYRPDGNHDCYYYATEPEKITKDDGNGGTEYRKDGCQSSPWKPSIFMPRWASRITLEITGVRVERLQDITEEDAKAEGCEVGFLPGVGPPKYKHGYRNLWYLINGKKHPWSSNPFVWVIEFRKLSH